MDGKKEFIDMLEERGYRVEYVKIKSIADLEYRPSSGLLACIWSRKQFPRSEIYLVGFQFKGTTLHNWKYERNVSSTFDCQVLDETGIHSPID